MAYLINETKHRRDTQNRYNKKNNIVPKTIFKTDKEIKNITMVGNDEELIEVNDELEKLDFDTLELKDIMKKIKRKMLNYAKELKFEEAALMRNKLLEIEEKLKNV